MNDIRNWLLGVLGSVVLAGAVWLVPAVVSVQGRQDLAERVVPAPVESALRELREKTNGQSETINRTLSIANTNTSQISDLKERMSRMENTTR